MCPAIVNSAASYSLEKIYIKVHPFEKTVSLFDKML